MDAPGSSRSDVPGSSEPDITVDAPRGSETTLQSQQGAKQASEALKKVPLGKKLLKLTIKDKEKLSRRIRTKEVFKELVLVDSVERRNRRLRQANKTLRKRLRRELKRTAKVERANKDIAALIDEHAKVTKSHDKEVARAYKQRDQYFKENKELREANGGVVPKSEFDALWAWKNESSERVERLMAQVQHEKDVSKNPSLALAESE